MNEKHTTPRLFGFIPKAHQQNAVSIAHTFPWRHLQDAIDPCGYPGLRVTRTCDHGQATQHRAVGDQLANRIAQLLGNSRGIER